MLRILIIALLVLAAILLLRKLFGRRPTEPVGREPPKMITMDGDPVAAEIEGQEFDIAPAVLDEVRQLAESGNKIEAIKRLREATGLGLTEAKQVVESLDTLKR